MILFMKRSLEQELMDDASLPDDELASFYREIRWIHLCLGNTSAILRLLRNGGPIHRVLDIGCGDGWMLTTVRDALHVEVVGLDLRPAPAGSPVPILRANAVTDALPQADVALCVTMAHHLSEAELGKLIANVANSCGRLILLDLVRHWVPLALFRLFVAPLVSRVSGNDGATSIRRAYTASELDRILEQALRGIERPVRKLRHTVGPFWVRQIVDICWDPAASV